MTEKLDACPKCGNDSYDTIRHSWRDGLPPFEEYYECCSCEHTWTAEDIEDIEDIEDQRPTRRDSMKTSELTGAALDWAVAECEGKCEGDFAWYYDRRNAFNYSTDWAQGGPIIEREGIGLDQYADYPKWQAFTPAPEQPSGHCAYYGPTPLLAAMRCYVASKLGDAVDVPEELK